MRAGSDPDSKCGDFIVGFVVNWASKKDLRVEYDLDSKYDDFVVSFVAGWALERDLQAGAQLTSLKIGRFRCGFRCRLGV